MKNTNKTYEAVQMMLGKKVEIRPNGTKRVATFPVGESRTQQQFKEQCNVNNIIAKFKKTGSVTHVRNSQNGVYMDLVDAPDLMQAENTVIQARQAFEALPAAVRQRFGHDPKNLIDFMSNEKNLEEAQKLGLVRPPAKVKPDPVVEEIKTLGEKLAGKLKNTTKTTRG